MKTVVAASVLFMTFLVCYEKEMFVLAYALFGLSLALGIVAVLRGHKKLRFRRTGCRTSHPGKRTRADRPDMGPGETGRSGSRPRPV